MKQAVLYNGKKKVVGQIIQDGISRITLAIIDGKGSKSIKGFDKNKWTVKYLGV